ncbi:hypothetical protein [Caproicibacterium sp. XB2]|jgi:uncharacterized protein HemY|uniref:hypothetical protein n=1 Tax=Caproicibacterium sp. XB2 TaxID=3388458 RepID=UPI000A28EB16|nr:hypothetical protein B6259_06705 [Ruminococcaceae bacterium CPB6]
MNENIDAELKNLISKLDIESRKNLISAINFRLAQQHTTSRVREFSSLSYSMARAQSGTRAITAFRGFLHFDYLVNFYFILILLLQGNF